MMLTFKHITDKTISVKFDNFHIATMMLHGGNMWSLSSVAPGRVLYETNLQEIKEEVGRLNEELVPF